MTNPLSLTDDLMAVIVRLENIESALKATTKNADDVIGQIEVTNAKNMLKLAHGRFMRRLDEPKLPEFNQHCSIPEKGDGMSYR